MVSKVRSSFHVRIVGALCLAAMFVPGAAYAASYSYLVNKGYKTSGLTKSRGGAPGWILSGGGRPYFCRLGVAIVLSGRNGMVLISSSGRQSPMNKAAYEHFRGGPNPSLPHREDLKAGRPRTQDVGTCVVY